MHCIFSNNNLKMVIFLCVFASAFKFMSWYTWMSSTDFYVRLLCFLIKSISDIALVKNNTAVGCQIACELSKLLQAGQGTRVPSKNTTSASEKPGRDDSMWNHCIPAKDPPKHDPGPGKVVRDKLSTCLLKLEIHNKVNFILCVGHSSNWLSDNDNVRNIWHKMFDLTMQYLLSHFQNSLIKKR